ncbi:MAG: methylthioribulose 1-phosphate dehydratase [Thiohalomonadaceae bacterium]
MHAVIQPCAVDAALLQARAHELVEAGRILHSQGWVPATSGNFSARLSPDFAAITASGRHKGLLTEQDIMVVDLAGQPYNDTRRPSAETLLHTMLYQRSPAVNAVLHTHSVNATLLSRQSGDELLLEGYELLKAFSGVHTHDTCLAVPVFANDQDIPRLARQVAEYLDTHADVHGYLIRGHGLYTWGRDVTEALRHVEAFEFLFQCELHQLRG